MSTLKSVQTIKRLCSKTYWMHALAFSRAARPLMLVPVILSSLATFFCKIPEGLVGPTGNTIAKSSDEVIWTMIGISFAMICAGSVLIVAMILTVWRLCIIARAYLLTPYEDTSAPKRVVFEKAIKEADAALNLSKGKLSLKLFCISLLQVPPLLALMCSASIVLIASPFYDGLMHGFAQGGYSQVMLDGQYRNAISGMAPLAIAVMIFCLIAINSLTVTGGAKAVLPNLSLLKSIFDTLKLSITHGLIITLVAIPVTVASFIITSPDFLLQIKAYNDLPGLTEPIWIVGGRLAWQAFANQWLVPLSIAVMLESVRVDAVPQVELHAAQKNIIDSTDVAPEGTMAQVADNNVQEADEPGDDHPLGTMAKNDSD